MDKRNYYNPIYPFTIYILLILSFAIIYHIIGEDFKHNVLDSHIVNVYKKRVSLSICKSIAKKVCSYNKSINSNPLKWIQDNMDEVDVVYPAIDEQGLNFSVVSSVVPKTCWYNKKPHVFSNLQENYLSNKGESYIVYRFCGGEDRQSEVDTEFILKLNKILKRGVVKDYYSITVWMKYIAFSTVTITTLGFGDVTPMGSFAHFLVLLQVLLGAFVWGVFVASVFKKITD